MQQGHSKVKFRYSIYALSIRHGLTLAIPFITVGAFALLLNNFPLTAYQEFLASFLNGALSAILTVIYEVTLGSLAFVLLITISLSYGKLSSVEEVMFYPLMAGASYLAFCGGIKQQGEYIFGAEWVFTAMCITLLSCVLFRKGIKLCSRFRRLHTIGAEYLFNQSILSIIPAIIIVTAFAALGYTLRAVWGDSNITNFGSYLFLRIFSGIGGNLPGILLYVLLSHFLWFAGIHGTNTLEAVSQRLFEQGVDVNQALVAAGQAPTQIYSKTFLDTFVFLGGCGCALSLVLALCFCARKSHNRKLARVALPSALFNISEIAVFGLPVIFNTTMLIPFVAAPLVMTLTSTLAMELGLVPLVTKSVGWTVPVLASGYQATGSVAGSILQLVNVFIGMLIYIPFVRRSEEQQSEEFCSAVRQMETDMAAAEIRGITPRFLDNSYPCQSYAQTLSMDLKIAISRNQLQLYYQPQVSEGNQLHGVEALLRWKHPVVGFIAPPVVVNLAQESQVMNEMTYYVLRMACRDAQELDRNVRHPVYMAVNISPRQLEEEDFSETVLEILKEYQMGKVHLVLEVTERSVLETSDRLMERINRLRKAGVEFSMDDFGMGHGSMVRLQENLFDEVKLDGNLVTQLMDNERSRDIVSGIMQMSSSLRFRVVAEFVENEEQKQMLESLGCTIYQGYYFGRPVELDVLLEGIQAG